MFKRAVGVVRFGFAVERIVQVTDGSVAGIEILAIDSPDWPRRRWRAWYAALPDIVHYAREREHLVTEQYVAVNIDSDQILDRHIRDAISRHADHTVIEWTERIPGDRCKTDVIVNHASRLLTEICEKRGLRLSFDDFGAGIDGYQRFGLVVPDFVKVDGRVLHQARTDRRELHLLKHMITLAHDMGAKVILEWVESISDREIAAAVGADCIQGFLYGRREYRADGTAVEKPQPQRVLRPHGGIAPG